FVTTTAAFGTAAPEASVTVPSIDPETTCARAAGIASAAIENAAMSHLNFVCIHNSPESATGQILRRGEARLTTLAVSPLQQLSTISLTISLVVRIIHRRPHVNRKVTKSVARRFWRTPLKITAIETIHYRRGVTVHFGPIQYLWVRIHTDEGITGLGET